MRPSLAANLALLFSALSLLLTLYSIAISVGDPAPWVPEAKTASRMRISAYGLAVAFLFLSASLWLIYRSFIRARKRAVLASLLAVVPLLYFVVFAFLWLSGQGSH